MVRFATEPLDPGAGESHFYIRRNTVSLTDVVLFPGNGRDGSEARGGKVAGSQARTIPGDAVLCGIDK